MSSLVRPARFGRAPLLRVPVLVLVASLVAAGCSSDPDVAAPTAPPTAASPTTTVAPTTIPPTTAAPTTTAPPTTLAPSTTVPPIVMPLTGLPAADPVLPQRRALVVKIDNHPSARPQFGLNAADIVFEENVEGLTRFAAVFHSTDVDQVGPIRSGRTQDVDLLGLLNKPLFAWSGGNPGVTAAVTSSDLVDLRPQVISGSVFFRQRRGNEAVEHTLYSSTAALWLVGPPEPSPPPQQFTYRAGSDPVSGETSAGVDVEMTGVDVTWRWDPQGGAYLRFQNGREHRDAVLGQVSASNVVVLEVVYRPSVVDNRSPEAQTIGRGPAWVFSGGAMVRGTWERADRRAPFTLLDAAGQVIALTPGRTWVELADIGAVTPEV